MEIEQNQALREFDQLNHQIETFYHTVAARLGFSDSAFIILRSLLELGDGCTQKDICDASFLNKQTVNSSVQKLIRDGVLRAQPGIGREMKLYLTENGEILMREKICPVINAESAVFDEMSIGERKELLRLTEKFLIQFKEKMNFIF